MDRRLNGELNVRGRFVDDRLIRSFSWDCAELLGKKEDEGEERRDLRAVGASGGGLLDPFPSESVKKAAKTRPGHLKLRSTSSLFFSGDKDVFR